LSGLLRRIGGIYATIPNYLEIELRYMDAGEQGPKAPTLGQRERRVTIAMSAITTSTIVTPLRRSVERTCDDLAITVLVAVGLIASLTFRDYGLGWDD